MPFQKFIYFRPPDFTMENSLSYVIFCWFFVTTSHQRIIFMFLDKISLKFCESFKFFLAVFVEKIQKICYLIYVRRIIFSIYFFTFS